MMKKEVERVSLMVHTNRESGKVRGHLFHKKSAPVILCLEIDYQVTYYNPESIHKHLTSKNHKRSEVEAKQLTIKAHNAAIKQEINQR
jgi:hypothetical protein